ncbi:hypothetical protein A3J43_01760 [Candidatus Uhrbacteria bacterium RIFCSPHIGHO2_12_FULL_54_23]|uniref:Endolytic murein transglycosylase n=1 Tax=Candidatus Uhrbacteria bacterium RIFCSPHIGHO2_12_FULL_54_23 TaxID=1802397 RepID=A0A1F7UIP1_9BACT|nr:MAG: hypothetical protein A3J43_01760 [Candidatus Uhrbacteria bacterium RIFCSPHIGHO2_12_FULL_54_23]
MIFLPRRFSRQLIIVSVLLMFAGAGRLWYQNIFGAPHRQAEAEQFVIPQTGEGDVAVRLQTEGFIRSAWAFEYARGEKEIEPGGYRISKAMNAWEIGRILTRPPASVWVIIREGLRKEEIAAILARKLGWSTEEREKWVIDYTAMDYDHVEGVYFPDTYLIPTDETPFDTAERMRKNFEAKFAPLADEALRQNIRWVTVVRIASLLEREAAGAHDMPLIAGVIWNRLLQNMRLQIDATLQYARGDEGGGWWAPISPADKQIDSPYNTYKHSGLPPHPIANPGLAAMNAVLYPEETDCLFYLHDRLKRIHCAATYEGHLKNIEEYLR